MLASAIDWMTTFAPIKQELLNAIPYLIGPVLVVLTFVLVFKIFSHWMKMGSKV